MTPMWFESVLISCNLVVTGSAFVSPAPEWALAESRPARAGLEFDKANPYPSEKSLIEFLAFKEPCSLIPNLCRKIKK